LQFPVAGRMVSLPRMTTAGGMLVAAPDRWDEACFAVPALRAIVAAGLPTGVLCRAEQREFWQTVEGVAVMEFPAKARAKQVAALAGGWAASMAWEAGVAAEAFKGAGIPRRLGPGGGKLGKLLSHPLAFSAGPLEHRVRYYLAAVEELGMATARAEFFAPAASGGGEGVLLCPDSDFGPSHEWLIERWVEIAEKFIVEGEKIAVRTVDGGRGLGLALAAKLRGQSEIVPVSAALGEGLSELGEHALVVAADGSLPHLAGHAGATCVVLFGPNDPAWRRPLGKRHAVVRRHVECAPCLLPKCPLDLRCQRELDVERVWRAVCATRWHD
jgi:ADP-heptose:LPS heptosyltransferase